MFFRIAVFSLCASLAASALASADEGKPLRTVIFDVGYSMSTTQENRISGLSVPLAAMGASSEHHGFGADDSGTMRVDVVAATSDRGLVVDTAYDGKITRQSKIRVAITADGHLLYDPKLTLSVQAARVLPLLARGLLANQTLQAGTTWSTPTDAPATGSTNYRVVTVDAPKVTIAVATVVTVSGPQGFDEHEDGTLVFATDLGVPLRWDVNARLHRATVQGTETTDTHLTATLKSDSFAKT